MSRSSHLSLTLPISRFFFFYQLLPNSFLTDDSDDSPSASPSAMPSSAPTTESGGSNPGDGNDGKNQKRRALADARGKLILNNIRQNRKKARNGANPNSDWDNNFF